MSRFDQGGAYVKGVPPITKKALRQACQEAPESVSLWSTSLFGGYRGKAADLPETLTFNVVGPDPYISRKWYASVNRVGQVLKVR